MEWVNYHHLLYFWMVAREGGLSQAGKVLRLSHPTLSAQIHALEDQLGEKLFTKVGRKLVLTDVGRVVFRYADEIFTLGREMIDTVRGRTTGSPLRLDVGIADAVPKGIVRRLLRPALTLAVPVRLVCHEGAYEKLLGDLAVHTLDIVISDAPVPPGSNVRAFNHLLGETGITFFGTKALVQRYRRGFPASLNDAPMLLPLETLNLRRSLNAWFERHRVRPRVVAEFADSALLQVFGSDGIGLFVAPTVVERELVAQYGVRVLGRTRDVRERFFAISVERRLNHPAVVAISDSARRALFAAS
ncbi:MAG: transcriptional activator NhaR [Pseudomonadota bacterium]|nr:MAG: transcriptional activator NhaR [Pseudomonadota bacterium]